MPRFESGWIRFDRKIVFGDIGESPNTLVIWAWCLCLANRFATSTRLRGDQVQVPPGSFVTGLADLAGMTKLAPTTVRRSLEYLTKTGRIVQSVGKEGRVITVVNFEGYLNDDDERDTQAEVSRNDGGNTAVICRTPNGQITNNKKKVAPPSASAPPGNELVGEYYAQWERKHHGRAQLLPVDHKKLKGLGESLGTEAATALVRAYFRVPNDWFAKKKHDVQTLVSNLAEVQAYISKSNQAIQRAPAPAAEVSPDAAPADLTGDERKRKASELRAAMNRPPGVAGEKAAATLAIISSVAESKSIKNGT